MRYARIMGLLLCTLGACAPALAAETDPLIWPRIASGMRLVDGEQPEVVMRARDYARNPEHFYDVLARAEPFLWYIVEAAELREMPLELALVPAVESGFNPQARSLQKARGLWQFLPSTGADFGLRETVNYDGRRDPIASTRAALRHLDRLKLSFNHDWLLALAAYNAGETRIRRAVNASRREQPTFWDLTELPGETRDYVPRLLGVALLVREPERFGVTLPRIYNRQAGELVALDRPRNIEAAAKAAGISRETLMRYNPGLKQPGNSGAKKMLLLPGHDAAALRVELARSPHPPLRIKVPEAKGRSQHVVAAGDTLWLLARRYQVSINDLKDWNELEAGRPLRLGRILVVTPHG